MNSIETVVRAQGGPLQRQTGRVYVHDIEVDGDENLTLGQRVEILDAGDSCTAARTTEVDRPPRATATSSRSIRKPLHLTGQFM